MKPTVTASWILSVCLAVSLTITACTQQSSSSAPPQTPGSSAGEPAPASPPGTPRQGGELVIGVPEKLGLFDPFGVTKKDAALTPYESLAYRGLLTLSPDGRLTGALASSYRIDRSGSKPAVVLTLRPGAKWSDGKPVTVEDVAFTLETYARSDYYGIWRNAMHDVQGVSPFRSGKAPRLPGVTTDAKKGEVRILLEQDDASFLNVLTAPLLPKHQLAGKPSGEIDKLSRSGGIIGAGPFQPKAMAENGWSFAANPHYYEGKPRLDTLKVSPVPAEKLAEEVEAGRVQLASLPPDRASGLEDEDDDHGRILTADGRGFHFLGFQLERPAMKDPAIRRALAQSVSREELARQVFFGYAAPATSPLATGTFAYAPGELPAFDREAALQTLSSKGYTKEKPLTLTLAYPADSAVRERMVQFLADSWKDLPVKLDVKALPPADFIAYLFGGQPVDLYLFAWTYPADPAGLREVWHSRERVGETGLNASRYHNPRADQLLDQARRMLPDEERKRLLTEWQRLFAADLPILPLVEMKQPYYAAANLKGMDDTLGREPFVNIHEWWFE